MHSQYNPVWLAFSLSPERKEALRRWRGAEILTEPHRLDEEGGGRGQELPDGEHTNHVGEASASA